MLHGEDLVNEIRMTGDIEGWWYFIGNYQLNFRTGRGVSLAKPAVMIIESPGTGAFECTGHTFNCKGFGDYEGKRLRARFDNDANPGVGDYLFTGVIY